MNFWEFLDKNLSNIMGFGLMFFILVVLPVVLSIVLTS